MNARVLLGSLTALLLLGSGTLFLVNEQWMFGGVFLALGIGRAALVLREATSQGG